MSKLLTEALADAKAVKATAYANAKAAIEESFQPSLQRMISAKLSEEEGDDEMDFEEEVPMDDSGDTGFGSFEDELGGGEESMEEPESEDDMELESLMRELDGMDDDEDPMAEGDDYEDEMMEGEEEDWGDSIPDTVEENDEPTDEEIYEMIVREMEDGGGAYDETAPDRDVNTESTEGGGSYEDDVPNRQVNTENRKLRNEVKKLRKQYNESLLVVTKLKNTINEINLLNAKLLYNTKVTRQFDLDKKQRTTVLENLDRAKNVREVKLVYTTICEALNKTTSLKRQGLKEGYASKATPTIKPKQNLNENNNMIARWKELANIK